MGAAADTMVGTTVGIGAIVAVATASETTVALLVDEAGDVASTVAPKDAGTLVTGAAAKRVPNVACDAGITVMLPGLPTSMAVVVTGASELPGQPRIFSVVCAVARDTTPVGPAMEMGVSCTQLSAQPCKVLAKHTSCRAAVASLLYCN